MQQQKASQAPLFRPPSLEVTRPTMAPVVASQHAAAPLVPAASVMPQRTTEASQGGAASQQPPRQVVALPVAAVAATVADNGESQASSVAWREQVEDMSAFQSLLMAMKSTVPEPTMDVRSPLLMKWGQAFF